MSRTHRALAMLALSLSLVGATTAVAVAQPAAVEDQNDRLLRNLQAAKAERTQAAVDQVRAGERNLAPAAPAEDQNDRLLRNLQAAKAERTQAAVQQVRAGERNLAPLRVVTVTPAPGPVVPVADVDVLATLLLGLIGGLVGGGAAMAGWTAARRRQSHRAAAAV